MNGGHNNECYASIRQNIEAIHVNIIIVVNILS